jgi:hypothetical protein
VSTAQQLTVFDAGPTMTMHVGRLVPKKQRREVGRKILVKHIRICRNSFVSHVERRYYEFALYRWKLVKKLINAFATFNIIAATLAGRLKEFEKSVARDE